MANAATTTPATTVQYPTTPMSLAALVVGWLIPGAGHLIQKKFIRGMLLMAFSNKTGALLLSTGNKSELATGFCTLYGDMAGGLAAIGDLSKTAVYALARWFNRQ